MHRECLAECMHQGMRGVEFAQLFHISLTQVTRDERAVKKRFALIAQDFDSMQFLGWLCDEAEWLISQAKKAGDFALAWKIYTDFTTMLQNFGVLRPLAIAAPADPNNPQQVLDAVFDQMTDEEFNKVKQVVGEVLEKNVNQQGTENSQPSTH